MGTAVSHVPSLPRGPSAGAPRAPRSWTSSEWRSVPSRGARPRGPASASGNEPRLLSGTRLDRSKESTVVGSAHLCLTGEALSHAQGPGLQPLLPHGGREGFRGSRPFPFQPPRIVLSRRHFPSDTEFKGNTLSLEVVAVIIGFLCA